MKRVMKFGELLLRAKRGEPLHNVDTEFFVALENAREVAAKLRDEETRDVMLALFDNYEVPGQAGRYPGWCRDETHRELLWAKVLLELGKQAYREVSGLERVRDDEEKLRVHAVKLLKEHRPQTSIDPYVDLRNFRTVPSAAVVAYVDEHMPEAKTKMQAYARLLAGKRRARAQQPERASLLR